MAIEEMRLVVLSTQSDEVYSIIETVMETRYFHPEAASAIVNEANGGLEYPNDKVYENYLNRIHVITHDLNLDLDEHFDREYSFDEIEKAIEEAEKQYETLHQFNRSENLGVEDKVALQALRSYNFDGVDEGLITLKFGRIPIDSVAKIYLHNEETFVFTTLHQTKDYAWIVYVAMQDQEAHIEQVFQSLYFEPIAIPMYDEGNINETCIEVLDHVYGYVKKMALQESYLKYICIFEDHLVIVGFIASEHLPKLETLVQAPLKLQDFPADKDKDLLAPTSLKNGWFSKPFEVFIKMYGLPKYGGFDPTGFFAFTYALLFGLMFGDLGQGLVLVLGGWYLYRKKGMEMGGVGVRIGISSMFFGTIFGSFFGNETLLEPLLKPFGLPIHVASPDFTMTLLLSAVALGVGLILSSILINILTKLKQKDYGPALFSQNGLSGFMLYGFVMVGIALSMMKGINIFNPLTLTLFIGVPLACILFIEPLQNLLEKRRLKPHEGWGGYLIEGIFELIEVILSFVTNTMSFLRVGGFVLSHAGMMIVVMTLNQMSGQYGIIVMVFGNILVIALEGLIVGIQTLRLEYYEMFSRYYEGGGKEFISVHKEKRI